MEISVGGLFWAPMEPPTAPVGRVRSCIYPLHRKLCACLNNPTDCVSTVVVSI